MSKDWLNEVLEEILPVPDEITSEDGDIKTELSEPERMVETNERRAYYHKLISAQLIRERLTEHNLLLDKELDLSEDAFFAWADQHYKDLTNKLKELEDD